MASVIHIGGVSESNKDSLVCGVPTGNERERASEARSQSSLMHWLNWTCSSRSIEPGQTAAISGERERPRVDCRAAHKQTAGHKKSCIALLPLQPSHTLQFADYSETAAPMLAAAKLCQKQQGQQRQQLEKKWKQERRGQRIIPVESI